MSDLNNVFDVGARALSAQMVRLNTTASNIANAGSVSSTPEGAFRPLRPVFETVYAEAAGNSDLATTDVAGIVALDRAPAKQFRPGDPNADADGFVYQSTVNVDEEMVEMTDASRQYQNILDSLSTLRTLMSRTLSMGQ